MLLAVSTLHWDKAGLLKSRWEASSPENPSSQVTLTGPKPPLTLIRQEFTEELGGNVPVSEPIPNHSWCKMGERVHLQLPQV